MAQIPEGAWLLRRAATGDLWHLPDLETLQQWIVEFRVLPEDEISRDAVQWQAVGALPEFAPLFSQASPAGGQPRRATELYFGMSLKEEAARERQIAPASPSGRADDTPVIGTSVGDGASASRRSVGATLPITTMAEPSARGTPTPVTLPHVERVTPVVPRPAVPAEVPRGRDGEEQTDQIVTQAAVPAALSGRSVRSVRASGRGGSRLQTLALVLTGVALLSAAGALWVVQREQGPTGPATEPGAAACQLGQRYLLLDSDDHLRLAEQQFTKAHAENERHLGALVGLAEVNALWATYLRDDASAIKEPGPANSLHKLAQIHLDDAHRFADDALRLGPGDAGAHRAMAAYLVASGAPAATIEPHLQAAARPVETSATAWLRGALLLRDGKIEEARRALENANRLSRQETNKDLVRADILLAQLALASGQREEARGALQRILEVNPQHVRARSILETLTPPAAAPSGAATPLAPNALAAPTAPTGAAPPPAATPAERAPTGSDGKVELRGYDTLIAQGRRLSEHGRSREAQRLFEKALEERPEGVEAHIGLAYCFLDSEHYSSAIDRFQHVLRLSPGHGDALIGLAETYKVRGDNERALDYYRQYLKAFPAGPKAEMARANVRDLEPEVARKSAPPSIEVKETPLPPAGGSP
jgi:tetratricopeptide (TPR) repeat protein